MDIPLLLGLDLPSPPSGREAVEDVAGGLGDWIWPFIAAIAFLETTIPPVSLFVPGEWALLFGGAIAGEGEIPIAPLVLLVWVSSAAGDSVAFLLGRRFGRGFLLRYGRRFRLDEARLERVDGWFDRYGPATVALGRLVNFVRPLAPILAGAQSSPTAASCPGTCSGRRSSRCCTACSATSSTAPTTSSPPLWGRVAWSWSRSSWGGSWWR